MKAVRSVLMAAALSVVLFACASSPKGDAFDDIDAGLVSGDYAAALAAIDKAQGAKKPLYDEKNQISLELDKGLLAYYAGDAAASSASLEKAESLIEEAFTKSVTADFASYIANDLTKDYAGEEYENIYLSVFNALNKYNQGDVKGAAVEIRKITGKLVTMEDRYGALDPSKTKEGTSLEGAVLGAAAIELGLNAALLAATTAANVTPITIDIPPDLLVTRAPIRYTDSTLARYISAIIYRSSGDVNDMNFVRQDIEGIKAAADREAAALAAQSNDLFNAQPDTPIYFNPASIAEEMNVPAGKGRLNIIAFAGRGAVKFENDWELDLTGFTNIRQFADGKNGLAQGKLALPNIRVFQDDEPITIEVTGAGDAPVKLELLEDIGAGMHAALGAKFKSTYAKTWIRAMVKYSAVEVAAAVAVAKGSPPIVAAAAAAGAKKGIDAGESADVRGSRYFPRWAYVGGITLDPGEYDITVKFNGADTVTKHVTVKAGALNLVEAISLK